MEGVDLVQRFIEDAAEAGGVLHGPHAIVFSLIEFGDPPAERGQLTLEFPSRPASLR
jgi:hypothetical protein